MDNEEFFYRLEIILEILEIDFLTLNDCKNFYEFIHCKKPRYGCILRGILDNRSFYEKEKKTQSFKFQSN